MRVLNLSKVKHIQDYAHIDLTIRLAIRASLIANSAIQLPETALASSFLNCYRRYCPVSFCPVASGNSDVFRSPPANQYCLFPSCSEEFGGKSGGKIGTAR